MNELMIEYFGYAASAVVAVSLMMSSIAKLRWYNLVGAALFAVYGLFIGSLPVFFLNGFIAAADVYYLVKLYRTSEHFSLLETKYNSAYAGMFLDFYKSDIEKIFPDFNFSLSDNCRVYFLLRDAVPAGIFIGRVNGTTMEILLDYATPQYRDLKLALFMFRQCTDTFSKLGVERFLTGPHSDYHEKYLQKLGFKKSEEAEGHNYVYVLKECV